MVERGRDRGRAPHTTWTLVGGLRAQLHAARALETLGYEMLTPIDPRERTAHRFVRGMAKVDLATRGTEVVDILIADHAAPRVVEQLRGKDLIAIEAGAQALRRTVNAELSILDERTTTVGVSNVFRLTDTGTTWPDPARAGGGAHRVRCPACHRLIARGGGSSDFRPYPLPRVEGVRHGFAWMARA